MPPSSRNNTVKSESNDTDTSAKGGVYRVKENVLDFDHGFNAQSNLPSTPAEFLDNFRRDFQMRILDRPSKNDLVLEFLNVDASFVNALRRILLAEIPTVAIELVYMWNNNSLLHDEVLSHRLGLIPLDVDARLMEEWDLGPDTAPTDLNTLVFRLTVKCDSNSQKKAESTNNNNSRSKNTKAREDDDVDVDDDNDNNTNADLIDAATQTLKQKPYHFPKDRPYTMHVYSRDLVWVPQNDQQERLGAVKPLHDDILIAKLRPGQQIELEAHARRGIGKDHAKFSPVATASYRLMPKIEILEPIYDQDADELVHVYEPGVFDLVPTEPGIDPPGKTRKAKVVNPYACTMSRNFMLHPVLAKSIRMSRLPSHFIFSIESVGMYDPGVLVAEALRVLQGKCRRVMDLADDTTSA